ncbi:MAG: hypothetical protein EOP88_02745 [Verrucomicrobiaceae bacterium]|nr:MAG: hypothetical protein EOP88_02745 [Verrucomicrobiaceae bacterium]
MIEVVIICAAALASLMAIVYPLSAALLVGMIYGRKNHAPPAWIAPVLWLIAMAAGMVLRYFPFGIPWQAAAPVVVGMVACGVTGAATLLGRRGRVTFRRAMAVSWVAGVMVMVWADLRFTIVVRDQAGNLADWTGAPPLCRPGRAPITFDAFAYGHKPVRGVLYIGLLKWLEYRDGWHGTYPDGSSFMPAGWWDWPRTLIQYVSQPQARP